MANSEEYPAACALRSGSSLMRQLKTAAVALMIASAGCASPEQRVDRHARQAAKFIANYEYRRAWRELEKARKVGVPCPQVDAIQGMMLARRHDLERAEKCLTAAVKAMPANHAARNNLAVVYLVTRRAPEALRILETTVKSGAQNSAILNNYGLALRVCGEPARAKKAFEQAMRANPRNADATANHAMCLYLNKRFKDAVAEWETAVYIDANNPEAWAGLCIGHAALGQAEKAREAAFRTLLSDSSYVNQDVLVNVRNWPRTAAADLYRVIYATPRFNRGPSYAPRTMKMNGTAQVMEDPLIEEARTQLARR